MSDSEMLRPSVVAEICQVALAEDMGSGDATTTAVVPADLRVTAYFNAREACVCAGLPVVAAVFAALDSGCELECLVTDGTSCRPRQSLAKVCGPARAILTGERVALNFLQRLSGIATETRRYVDAAGGAATQILDTRKTTPGLRVLEKYAVRMGGGQNHRFGLYDRIMIKDNHRALAALEGPGGIARAVAACRREYPALEVEVEADTLNEVAEARDAGADYILLDNMTDEEVAEAVSMVAGRSMLEASGGVTLSRIPALSRTGVDFISVGALTHSAAAVDIGLDLEP